MKRALRDFGLPLVAVTAALSVVLVGLAIGGYPPFLVLARWVAGAVGTQTKMAASLQEACPLLLTGLAAAVAFRCGVLNIGAEGQFMLGALGAAALTTKYIAPGPAWLAMTLAILAGAVAGALWALVAGLLEHWRGVPVVLSTILLNFVAIYLAGVLLLGPLQAPRSQSPQTPPLADGLRLSVLMTGTQLHVGVLIALGLALLVWIMQERTVLGFELLVTGVNPTAAELAGIPVARRRLGVIALSGALAGLGGALEVMGITYFLTDSPTGYGYAGIAVALLGRLHPLGVAAAAVFFGMLDVGARHVEKDMSLAVPHSVADIVKGAVVLAMLVGSAWLVRQRSAPRQAEESNGGEKPSADIARTEPATKPEGA